MNIKSNLSFHRLNVVVLNLCITGTLIFPLAFHSCASGDKNSSGPEAEVWVTTLDAASLIELREDKPRFRKQEVPYPVIKVSEDTLYQEIDGFGYTLTGGSAGHIWKMDQGKRYELLEDLFSREKGIGVSYLRLSIGASDLDEYVFSYDDMPEGETDVNLEHFSLDQDRRAVIPVLKEILRISPDMKIMGSPWSAPVWMKDNGDTRGGSLRKEYYGVYAEYFVKYIRGMEEEGIPIDAITVQNEPLHPGNNPSMFMPAADQAEFIRDHLGPAFERSGIKTKIIVYDHNADRPDYPLEIYADQEAARYIDGSAFHLYGGRIETLSDVHNAVPDKNLYFTEQWVGAPQDFAGDLSWHIGTLIIGATRNWCRTVLEWNLAADPQQEPHTDRGGCTRCLGAVTIHGDSYTRNVAYYIIAHASKFVPPGSQRIWSSEDETLPNVAFRTPEGKIVLIVQNAGETDAEFGVNFKGITALASLPAGAVATIVW